MTGDVTKEAPCYFCEARVFLVDFFSLQKGLQGHHKWFFQFVVFAKAEPFLQKSHVLLTFSEKLNQATFPLKKEHQRCAYSFMVTAHLWVAIPLEEPEVVFIAENVETLFIHRVDVSSRDEKVVVNHRLLRVEPTLSLEKLRKKRSHHHLCPLLRCKSVYQIH